MEHGDIVEKGTHEQLIAAQGAYWRLYQSQFEQAASDTDAEEALVTGSITVPVEGSVASVPELVEGVEAGAAAVAGAGSAPVAVAERVMESAEAPERPSIDFGDDRI